VLGDLRRVGLIASQGGVNGGLRLARRPEQINLQTVYEAIEDSGLFALHTKPPNPECPVGGHIEPVLQKHFGAAERAMIASLHGVTLSDVVRDVLARNGAERPQ
jgi:DNA-binding IscR family transcriptional regulator